MADFTRDTTGEPVAGNGSNGHGLRTSTASRLRDEGAQLAETARDSAMRAADARKSQAAGLAHDLSSALHKGAEHLEEQGREGLAHYFDLAAGAAEQFGSDLEGKDIGELMDSVKDFARRRPTLVFGAALLVGFGLARFAMSGRGADETASGEIAAAGPADALTGPGPSQTGPTPMAGRPTAFEMTEGDSHPSSGNPKPGEKP